MRFSSRMTLFTVIPAILHLLVLMHTQREFDHYIRTEQAIECGLTDMYAARAVRRVVTRRPVAAMMAIGKHFKK